MTTRGSGVLAWCGAMAIVLAVPSILLLESRGGYGYGQVVLAVGVTGMTVVLGLILLSMVVRFRHARREVRTQLKWIA